MDSAIAHRKIELQDPEDLTYLINNVRRAAAESIAAAFPPVEGANNARDKDDLHTRIEELVNEYIYQTFKLAAPNLSINGLDFDPKPYLADLAPSSSSTGRATAAAAAVEEEEVFEPFDGRKRQRVEDLSREEEDLLSEIAALKRRVPAEAAAAWGEAAKRSLVADEEAAEAARTAVADRVAAARASGRGSGVDVPPLERQVAVEAAWRTAVDVLGRCKREMPAAVARMERARVAGEYAVTGR